MNKNPRTDPVIATTTQVLLATLLTVFLSLPVFAGPSEQAKRIHDRLAGVPPSEAVLMQMENAFAGTEPECVGFGVTGAACAAYIAMENVNFYSVTLKNFAAPWTNRAQSAFVPLNDYIATVIGFVRDSEIMPFNTLLSTDFTYVGRQDVVAADPSPNDNLHYEQLEANNVNLRDDLERVSQSSINGLPPEAASGVMTSRAASEAFFIAGTNRAMFRFTVLNHMCNDMEQLHDPGLPTDRIRQDVSRSPGGDSRLFLNNCVGCHTGMDPFAGAFAHYNFNESTGALEYTPDDVQLKYFNNDLNFPQGFRTADDHWANYWRSGQNSYLGFDPDLPGEGYGAKTMGEELGNSYAFAACQVKKVFRSICLRDPENQTDRDAIDDITDTFRMSNYRMKQVFADVAVHCMGQ